MEQNTVSTNCAIVLLHLLEEMMQSQAVSQTILLGTVLLCGVIFAKEIIYLPCRIMYS